MAFLLVEYWEVFVRVGRVSFALNWRDDREGRRATM
jgi:hypothetical protein